MIVIIMLMILGNELGVTNKWLYIVGITEIVLKFIVIVLQSIIKVIKEERETLK